MNELTARYYEFHEPVRSHEVVVQDVWPLIRQETEAGRAVAIEIRPVEEARELRLNREYWGYVLRPISEQAQVDGIGSTPEGWHDYYRLMFLGYEISKVRLPGKRRASVRRTLKSTTKLSNRQMREYMEQVRAHAAITFGVEFPVPPWVEEERRIAASTPVRKTRTVIDNETGEITEVAA